MNQTSVLSGARLIIATVFLSLATFLIVLDAAIANVSLPYIAGDLAVSTDEGTYVITSFAVGNGIALPVCGWLTKRLGIVRLLITSLLLFAFASWLCGISWNLSMLVGSRFIQGAVAGPLIPLSQTLIISIYPPKDKNFATALWSSVAITAPIFGPILGGWISYDYHWPWIFYINIPIAAISAFIIYALLKDHETQKERTPIDWVGLLLLIVGVSSLQVFLDKGQEWDWWNSPAIRMLASTALISFTILIAWEYFHKTPLMDFKLFKIRSYLLATILLFVMYSIYFASIVIMPLWLQRTMNYTPIWAGLAVAPMGIIPCLFAGVIGKLVGKFSPIFLLLLSILFFSSSFFFAAYFYTDVTFWDVALSRFWTGFGILFFITPLFVLSMQNIPQEQLPSSNGMFQFFRSISGGIGTSLVVTLWERRTSFHHLRLGERLTSVQEPYNQMSTLLAQQGITGVKKQEVINNLLDQQSQIMAFDDCLYLMAFLLLCLIVFLPLGRSRKEIKTKSALGSSE